MRKAAERAIFIIKAASGGAYGGKKMKVLLLNGSPRKEWNTAQLLHEAERGAREAGAETERFDLYNLDYKDCRSCFACKRIGNTTGGVCAVRDGLRPVLESAAAADAIIIGSPIYYGNVTAPVIAFINRLLFADMHYDLEEDGRPVTVLPKTKKTALILTMNIPEEGMLKIYKPQFDGMAAMLGRILGSGEVLYSCDTWQFDDYSKYYAGRFDVQAKARRREEQFPVDKQNAYELGKRMAVR